MWVSFGLRSLVIRSTGLNRAVSICRGVTTFILENSGQVVEMPGSQLLQNGIPVRLDENLSSELLVIEQK